MNSQLDDVLHKKKFAKITKNSPISNQDECLEPPSFFESFCLDNSGQSNIQPTPYVQEKINKYFYDNCNQWSEVNESIKAQKIIQNKNIQIKNQEIQSATQIAQLINCLLQLWNNIFKALLAFILPYLILFEEDEIVNHLSHFLLFYILIITLIYIFCQSIQIKQKEKLSAIYKFIFIDDFVITNISLIGLLLIIITLNTQIIVIILSFYFFYEGYNQIERFCKLLIITKSNIVQQFIIEKYYNYLAISKILVYYLYLLHLFTCLLYDNDFQLKYKDSLLINITFFTFQANYYESEETSNLTMIFSQMVGLIMLFNTIDVIIQIRLKKIELQNRPKINVHILHYYIWHLKGNLLEKLKLITQLNNNCQLTKQIGQNAMKIVFQQILDDYQEISHIFTKQFIIDLSERIKVQRKAKEIDFNKNFGLYLILRGQGQISFKKEGLRRYQQNIFDKVFGLIDCFQLNISDQTIILEKNILVLFVKEEDFKACLNSNQDIETYHMIKNKILFEGDTSYINYKCLMCNGFHLMRRCQVQQDIYRSILKDQYQQNKRSKVKRRLKREPCAFKTYLKKIKKSISATFHNEFESSESSSNYEQLQVNQEEPNESQKFTDRNMIIGHSKGTLTIPTISKEFQGDFISDKILLEQMKSSHKQISGQLSIQPGSQQFGDGLKTDYKSQQLSSTLFKFQDIVTTYDIDIMQEYVYFHPEFNISSIILILQK